MITFLAEKKLTDKKIQLVISGAMVINDIIKAIYDQLGDNDVLFANHEINKKEYSFNTVDNPFNEFYVSNESATYFRNTLITKFLEFVETNSDSNESISIILRNYINVIKRIVVFIFYWCYVNTYKISWRTPNTVPFFIQSNTLKIYLLDNSYEQILMEKGKNKDFNDFFNQMKYTSNGNSHFSMIDSGKLVFYKNPERPIYILKTENATAYDILTTKKTPQRNYYKAVLFFLYKMDLIIKKNHESMKNKYMKYKKKYNALKHKLENM